MTRTEVILSIVWLYTVIGFVYVRWIGPSLKAQDAAMEAASHKSFDILEMEKLWRTL